MNLPEMPLTQILDMKDISPDIRCYAESKVKHPSKIVLIRFPGDSAVKTYGKDAVTVDKVLDVDVSSELVGSEPAIAQIKVAIFPYKDLKASLDALHSQGYDFMLRMIGSPLEPLLEDEKTSDDNENKNAGDESINSLIDAIKTITERLEVVADNCYLPENRNGQLGRMIAVTTILNRTKTPSELKILSKLIEGRSVKLSKENPESNQKDDQAIASPIPETEQLETQPETGLRPDQQFEACIVAIASMCDGAATWDGAGFNKYDSGFGKDMASVIRQGGKMSSRQARACYKMMVKYQKQLSRNNLELPPWDKVEEFYFNAPKDKDSKPSKRLELAAGGKEIHAYTAYQDKDSFKAIGYIRFDWDAKAWIFGKDKAIALVDLARELDYAVSAGVERVCQLEQKRIAEENKRKEAAAEAAATDLERLIKSANLDQPLPCGWSLFDHQKEAAEWLLSHGKSGAYNGGILADQMGLGKSISALVAAKAAANYYNCHIIVICPASLKANWLIEAERVGVEIDVYSWAKMPNPTKATKYLLIADEAHYAQNPKSLRTKKFWKLSRSQNCLYAWLLTGTPLKNGRPINLYPLLYAVDHPLSRSRHDYELTYCNAALRIINSQGREVWDNKGASCLDDLSKLTQDVILQRKKADCLDLPPKLRSYRPIELSTSDFKSHVEEINALVRNYKDRAKEGKVAEDAEALVTLGAMRRIGSKYKVDAAIEMATDLLDQNESVVIFTDFVESAHAIADKLRAKNITVELLDGSVPTQDRQPMVDRFQAGESKVFVRTIKAGGVGSTLTRSHYVIMVDRPWTPGDTEQAEDRCHRIGTKDTVISTWLQLGEIDNLVDALIEKKQDRIDLVMAGKRKTLRGIGNVKDLAKELLKTMSEKL